MTDKLLPPWRKNTETPNCGTWIVVETKFCGQITRKPRYIRYTIDYNKIHTWTAWAYLEGLIAYANTATGDVQILIDYIKETIGVFTGSAAEAEMNRVLERYEASKRKAVEDKEKDAIDMLNFGIQFKVTQDDNAALRQRVKELEEALRFYADGNHIVDDTEWHTIKTHENYYVHRDIPSIREYKVENGDNARKTLEGKEGAE